MGLFRIKGVRETGLVALACFDLTVEMTVGEQPSTWDLRFLDKLNYEQQQALQMAANQEVV
jgi:hypothetical protein